MSSNVTPNERTSVKRPTWPRTTEPGSFGALPIRGALFIALVVCVGFWVFLVAIAQWSSPEPLHFLFYLVIAIFASALKIALPTVNGEMSINFFFILIGLVDLSLPET